MVPVGQLRREELQVLQLGRARPDPQEWDVREKEASEARARVQSTKKAKKAWGMLRGKKASDFKAAKESRRLSQKRWSALNNMRCFPLNLHFARKGDGSQGAPGEDNP